MVSVLQKFDWSKCGRRLEDDQGGKGVDINKPVDTKAQILFDRNICKLHGDMEHGERKKNFFAFDKSTPKSGDTKVGSVLVCTDVASRGLDFKNIAWVIQFDLSSQVKEYVNRIGRTARIATQGSALCFVMP